MTGPDQLHHSMDAKNIFIACQAKVRQVEWERPSPDSEWSYLGEANDLGLADLQQKIAEFISSPQLFIVTDRHHSRSVSLLESAGAVRESLKLGDVTLCDHAFERFMVFSRVGVVKRGRHHFRSGDSPVAGG